MSARPDPSIHSPAELLEEISREADTLLESIAELGGIFDIPTLRQRVALLDEECQRPGFWDDAKVAQATLKERNGLIARADLWDQLLQRANDLTDYVELARESLDESFILDLQTDLVRLRDDFAREETKNLLAGEADHCNAIVAIQAGAGGVDAMDWCAMLGRMLTRFGERQGWRVEILDEHPGEEAGLKGITLRIAGENAYGFLRSERGVHRLVRLSPFDAAHRRHTSFASVAVSPEIDDTITITINEDDVKMEFMRSSSAGGQHVNKTSSAVRLTHQPTGISVMSQNQRSQHQNRAVAWKVLQSRLYELELEKREEEAARERGSQAQIAWGQQIRSYVFQPYTQVKDKRTGLEVSDVQGVMDGKLDPFIQAYLRHQLEGGEYLSGEDED
ncbi:MAG: peptide chain release factor 2 [bacterium]